MLRRPNPGESKSKYINRDFINQLLKPEPKHFGKEQALSSTQITIDTMLGDDSTVNEVRPYEVIKFHGSPFIPSGTLDDPGPVTAKGYRYNEANKESIFWGIAQDWITKTSSAPVLISGVSWLLTESLTLPTANTYLQYIDLFGTALRICFNGRGTIINTPQKPYSIVVLDQSIQPLRAVTTGSGLTVNTPGTAFLVETNDLYSWTATTKQIPCWTDLGNIAPNKPLLLMPTLGIWYALEICP